MPYPNNTPRREKTIQFLAVSGVFLVLMGVGALAAGIHAGTRDNPPTTWDLSTVTPCPQEDGPGPDGPGPCVWDATVRGCSDPALVASSARHEAICQYARTGPIRWVLYADDVCPSLDTIRQPAAHVECVRRWDWSGGLSGTRP